MNKPSISPMVWEYDVPLFSREMQFAWLKAMLATAVLMCGLFVVILGSGGHWKVLGGLLPVFLAIVLAIYLLGLLIMLLVFRGHNRMRFTLDETGILCQVIDRTVRRSNRLAILLGILLREPRLAGAGLLARSREETHLAWLGRYSVETDPQRRLLRFKNGWRVLLTVYCTPENYLTVVETIAQQHAGRKEDARTPQGSPLPGYFLRTLGLVLLCLPFFWQSSVFRTTLFLPIFILCFVLASFWLIEIFGYVVLGGMLLQWGGVFARLMEVRHSWLFRGKTYRAWEMLSGNEMALLGLAAMSSLALAAFSWRAVRGRCPAVLSRDHADMEGDD